MDATPFPRTNENGKERVTEKYQQLQVLSQLGICKSVGLKVKFLPVLGGLTFSQSLFEMPTIKLRVEWIILEILTWPVGRFRNKFAILHRW